jgi:hypothetical protein
MSINSRAIVAMLCLAGIAQGVTNINFRGGYFCDVTRQPEREVGGMSYAPIIAPASVTTHANATVILINTSLGSLIYSVWNERDSNGLYGVLPPRSFTEKSLHEWVEVLQGRQDPECPISRLERTIVIGRTKEAVQAAIQSRKQSGAWSGKDVFCITLRPTEKTTTRAMAVNVIEVGGASSSLNEITLGHQMKPGDAVKVTPKELTFTES